MMQQWDADSAASAEGHVLDQVRALDRFLSSVEKRAFRIARIAVRHDDDALDIVQDAMLQLARRYGQRPERRMAAAVLSNSAEPDSRLSAASQSACAHHELVARVRHDGGRRPGPDGIRFRSNRTSRRSGSQPIRPCNALEAALAVLPGRQQEAFMLRVFEGMDVAETASAMGCGEGSVKTHYSRAVHTLRERLGDAW